MKTFYFVLILLFAFFFIMGAYSYELIWLDTTSPETTQDSPSIRIIEEDSSYHILCIDGVRYFAGILDGSHKIIRILNDTTSEPLKCSIIEEE